MANELIFQTFCRYNFFLRRSCTIFAVNKRQHSNMKVRTTENISALAAKPSRQVVLPTDAMI